MKKKAERINPSATDYKAEMHTQGTREFEGEYWQRTFAELLKHYKSFVPSTAYTFGTITRAELISKLHECKRSLLSPVSPNHKLYYSALKADEEWSKELKRVFGRNAGDARYDSRGVSTPLLLSLNEAFHLATEEWRKSSVGTNPLPTATGQNLELVDLADKHPEESPLQIAVRQSTVCVCGKPKAIGNMTCGCSTVVTKHF